jgi:2',3'-cyclic-nucleotide 2'-phosphodiesterase (5'-nucleotidase family)
MSSYKLSVLSIFFLALLFCLFLPHNILGQSTQNLNSKSQQTDQFLAEILFVGNINGVIENCNCGKPPLGGLPQINSIINRQICKNQFTYFIDGGDFFNTYPYALLNEVIIDIYKKMNITYLALGDQEWIDTDKHDQKVLISLKDKIIASNFTINKTPLNKYAKINLKDETTAGIISYLDEKAFFVSDDKKSINFVNDQFVSIYNTITAEADLIILIFHGTSYTLEWINTKFPKINLVLYAHEQSNINITLENPVVVGGGADGEYVKQIKIYRRSEKYHFEVNSIPVSSDLETDPDIYRIIDQFKLADKAEKGE